MILSKEFLNDIDRIILQFNIEAKRSISESGNKLIKLPTAVMTYAINKTVESTDSKPIASVKSKKYKNTMYILEKISNFVYITREVALKPSDKTNVDRKTVSLAKERVDALGDLSNVDTNKLLVVAEEMDKAGEFGI